VVLSDHCPYDAAAPRIASPMTHATQGDPDLIASRPDRSEVHPRLTTLFEALDGGSVAWAVLRGESDLDGRPGDIDLLVDPEDLARFGVVARRLGFARLPSAGYGSHEFLIAYDEATDRWLKLDTVSELAFGRSFAIRLPSVTTTACLERRRRSAEVALLDPADGFWTLLLHGLLDKRLVDDGTRTRLAALAPDGRAGGPVADALSRIMPPDWTPDGVVAAVVDGGWAALDRLGRTIAREWQHGHRGDAFRRRALGPLQSKAARLARLQHPRGLAIVLVGEPDTTARVASKLALDLPLPVRNPTLPPPGRGVARALRDRRRQAEGLVVYRAATLDAVPPDWTGTRRSGRAPLAEALSSPAPDLIIVLGSGGAAGKSDGAREIRSTGRADVRIVDVSVAQGRAERTVAGLVWERLAERWNAVDRRSPDHQ
jgi:hypothetical protein